MWILWDGVCFGCRDFQVREGGACVTVQIGRPEHVKC
jgi:hypothetical protein